MTHDFPDQSGFDPQSFEEFLARFFGAGRPSRPTRRVDLSRLMDSKAREVVADALKRATESDRTDLDAPHLLWALLRYEPTRNLVVRTGADAQELDRAASAEAERAPQARPGVPMLTPTLKRALLDAHQIAKALSRPYIAPEHLLFALAVNGESPMGRRLSESGVTPDSLQAAARSGEGGGGVPPTDEASTTPTLDEYGTDITALASEGRLDPVVGRDEQVEQTIEVLARRKKNNPVLIGDPGVGKTAIVEGIAQRIADDEIPETLSGRRSCSSTSRESSRAPATAAISRRG